MRREFSILSLAAFAGLLVGVSATQAAQNAPLCFAIAENYNNCLRQHQRPHHWGGGWSGGGGGYGGGYGRHDDYDGGYGGGYGRHEDHGGGYGGGGYGGGYGDYDDEYGQYRRARRRHRAQAQCSVWLAQMHASGCI